MNLQAVKLFEGLEAKDLELIGEAGRSCVYPPGTTVFVGGQEADGLYVVLAGRIKVSMLCPEGREKTLAIMTAGETLGEVTLFGRSERSATIETLETTQFLVISRENFYALLNKVPSLSIRIIEIIADRLRRANKQIEELTFHNARSRVIYALIYLAEEHGRKKGGGMVIYFSLTHAELAKLAGVTRETVTKILNELKDKELLNLPRGRIELLDLSGLKQQIF